MLPESERRLDYWIFAELLSQGKSSESVKSNARDFPDKDDFIESFVDKQAYDLGYVKREYLELILLYKLKSSGRSLVRDVKALDAEIRKRETELAEEEGDDYSDRIAIRSLTYKKKEKRYYFCNSPLYWFFEHIEELEQSEDKAAVIPYDLSGLRYSPLSPEDSVPDKIWDDYSDMVANLMKVVPKNRRTSKFKFKMERQLKSYRLAGDNGLGIPSYFFDDLISFKKLLKTGYGKSAYEKSVLAYVEGREASNRQNISPDNEKVGDIFKKHLIPSKAPCGKWPSKYSPYLMQQLAVNVFHENKAPILSVNGPPGTGKTTFLKQVIADVITQKAYRMAEILEENDYDPDELFNEYNALKPKYRDLYEYGILVVSSTNFAVENVTASLTDELEEANAVLKFPFAAVLGKSENINAYLDQLQEYQESWSSDEDYKVELKSIAEDFLKDYKQLKKDLSNADDIDLINDLTKKYTNGEDRDQYIDAEKSNPGINGFNDRRSKLFLDAWKLHQYFALSSKAVMDNFEFAKKLIKSYPVKRTPRYVVDVYNILFLISPVITSTLASVGKMFKHLDKPSSMGILISDESGQTSPQCPMGALFRSSRALVVGDPKQIPPVVPPEMVFAQYLAGCLMGYESEGSEQTSEKRDAYSTESFQTYADRINEFGKEYKDGTWIGIPFVLHSRCGSPMFEIANEISYENSMINVSQYKDPSGLLFDKSCWIQVKGREKCVKGSHFVKRQADVVIKLILHKYKNAGNKPENPKELKNLNLYVITPFVSVRDELIRYMENRMDKNIYRHLKFHQWLKNNIGTIHTFQGRETDEVILLLGCSDGSIESARWIYTNIVNVAVTRAKRRLYVVGDFELWSKHIPESPVNRARQIMRKMDKKYELGLAKVNELKPDDIDKLPIRRDKGSDYDAQRRYLWFDCPKCGSPVIYCFEGKYAPWEWKCTKKDEGCGLVFRVDDVPLKTSDMRRILGTKKEKVRHNSFDPNDKISTIRWLYPHEFTSPDENGNVFFKTERWDNEEMYKKANESLAFEEQAPKLTYHNHGFLKNVNIDYFGRRILDVIFSLYSLNNGSGFSFNSLDVLLIMLGNVPVLPIGSKVRFSETEPQFTKSKMRDEIDNRIREYVNKNYLKGITVKHRKKYDSYSITGGKLGEVKESAVPSEYMRFPIIALNDANENGGAFPVKCEWIELKFYILLRIAKMYNIKTTTNRIKFQSVKKTAKGKVRIPIPNPKNRMEKKRFISRLENFLNTLKEHKMIMDWDLVKHDGIADEIESYCGLAGIDINPGFMKGKDSDKIEETD